MENAININNIYENVDLFNGLKEYYSLSENDFKYIKDIFRLWYIKQPWCDPDGYYFDMDKNLNLSIFKTDFSMEEWGTHIYINNENSDVITNIITWFGWKFYSKKEFLLNARKKFNEIIDFDNIINKFKYKNITDYNNFIDLLKSKWLVDNNTQVEGNNKLNLINNLSEELITKETVIELFSDIDLLKSDLKLKLETLFLEKVLYDFSKSTVYKYNEIEEEHSQENGILKLIINRDESLIESDKLLTTNEFLNLKLSDLFDYNKDYESQDLKNFDRIYDKLSYNNPNQLDSIQIFDIIDVKWTDYMIIKTRFWWINKYSLVYWYDYNSYNVLIEDIDLNNISLFDIIKYSINHKISNYDKISILSNMWKNSQFQLNLLFSNNNDFDNIDY